MTKLEKLAEPELGYKIEIEVPKEEVEKAYQKRLGDVVQNVELKGFRKGRVPNHVVESKFGDGICQEVANEVIQLSFQSAISENKLTIAGQPKIEASPLKKGMPFQYSATFEVYPKIDLIKLDGVTIKKETVEVSSREVDNMLVKMQQQQADWVESDDQAKSEWRVNIDFEGFKDGEPFEGGSSEGFNLVLGSGQFIAGFEDALIGSKKGDKKEIPLTFPEAYPVQDLAGKDVVFHVTVNSVEAPVLPTVDEEFAKKAGFDSLELLKEDLVNRMQGEVNNRLRNRFKVAVLDTLLSKNPLVIPNSLVDVEVEHMQKMSLQQMAAQQGKKEIPDVKLPKEPYIEEATKRVKLGLLLAEVIKALDVKLDSALVRQRIEEMAANYKEKEQVIAWYYNNKNMMAEVEASVLEDQAIELLAQSAIIEEEPVSYEEAIKDN